MAARLMCRGTHRLPTLLRALPQSQMSEALSAALPQPSHTAWGMRVSAAIEEGPEGMAEGPPAARSM